MSMIQKVQPQVTSAAKKANQYLAPYHVFSKKEIQEAADMVKKSMSQESIKSTEYFSPSSPIASATVDKAVVGQKLDIVEGHMFG